MTEAETTTGSEPEEPEKPLFTMTVSLSTVKALGINLYSNAAAALAEQVANAYDADASSVNISWDPDGDKIVITDDGSGMTLTELNERFLTVGYDKRKKEGSYSPKWNRPFMGRKGIGKLSVFSVAETVKVYSTKNGESHGFEITLEGLLEAIVARGEYYPNPIGVPAEHAKQGTSVVLTCLKSKRADITAKALRRRLARRFDVLDPKPATEGGFRMFVNSDQVDWEDRLDLKKLQFIWSFGDNAIPDHALDRETVRVSKLDHVVDAARGWRVSGWLGTVAKPSELRKTNEDESLANIIVLARRRPIQEGILEQLEFSRVFASYVTGQIEADFLDLDGSDYADIATSDRQRLIEDDERVVALTKFLRKALVRAAEDWSKLRPPREKEDVLKNFPRLREWIDRLDPWQQSHAETLIGTIASLHMDEKDRQDTLPELLRAGVLAFERAALRKGTTDLQDLTSVTAEKLLPLLGRQDVYETALWGDILRSRLEAIDKLRQFVNEDRLERVLEEHLFEHLWLLDPAWERTTGSERMEQDLRRFCPGLYPVDAEGERIYGRVDMRYATVGGTHVLVELKKYKRVVGIEELADQGLKYYEALRDLLEKQGEEDPRIGVVFVLGRKPTVSKRGKKSAAEYIKDRLGQFDGVVRYYDELIANAQDRYQAYLDASQDVRELNSLLDSLDVKAAPEVEPTEADIAKAE